MSSTTSGTESLPTTAGPVVLTGTPVVPGVAFGPVIRPSAGVALPAGDRPPLADDARPAEKERFTAAASAVAGRLERRAAAATGVSAEVLAATAGLARDRGLLSAVEQRIDGGAAAEGATVQAAGQFVELFTSLGGLMAGRAAHVRDGRDRIVGDLTRPGGGGAPVGRAARAGSGAVWPAGGGPGPPPPAVPPALPPGVPPPADPAGLAPPRVIGLAPRLGGTTSHTAIIARQLGLPCVVAVGGLDDVPAGVVVLLDGEQGTVTIEPDADEARVRVDAARVAAEALAGYEGPATTRD